MHIKVPWIGVIAVGIGFLISLVLNIRYWVEFMNRTINLVGDGGLAIVLRLPAASYPTMHMTQDGVKVFHCMSMFTVGASHAIVYAHCIHPGLRVHLTLHVIATGPGARLLHLLLVYLTFGTCPSPNFAFPAHVHLSVTHPALMLLLFTLFSTPPPNPNPHSRTCQRRWPCAPT